MPSAPIKFSDLIVPDDSIDKLLEKLTQLNTTYTAMMNDMIKQAKDWRQALSGASGATSSGRSTITESAAKADALQKAQERLQQAMSENAQQIARLNQITKEYNKENEIAARIANSLNGSYNNLVARLAQLKMQYQSLSESERKGTFGQNTAKEIANVSAEINSYNSALKQKIKLEQLSRQEAESAEGSYNKLTATYQRLKIQINAMGEADEKEAASKRKLEQEAQRVYQQMIKLQEATGRHQLSVGNYAKSWDGLRFSVFQVVRELPNAAISLNTLFLALSNNIPIVADEIKRAGEEAKAAAANGDKSVGVLRRIVGALFSFNTVLILVITAFTMFGDKIVDWIKGLFSGRKAVISMGEALDNVDKKLASDATQVGKNIAEYKKLAAEWQRLKTTKEKNQFIKDNTTAFNNLGIAVNDVSDAEDKFVRKTADVIRALTLRAKAAAAQELAAEEYKKMVEEDTKADKEAQELDKSGPGFWTRVLGVFAAMGQTGNYGTDYYSTAELSQGGAEGAIEIIRKRAREAEKNGQTYMNAAEEYARQADELVGKPTKNKPKETKTKTPNDITTNVNEMIRNIQQALSESATAISGSGFDHDLAVIGNNLTKAINKMDSAKDKIDKWLNNPKKYKLTKKQRETLEGLKDTIETIKENYRISSVVQSEQVRFNDLAEDSAFELKMTETDQSDLVGQSLEKLFDNRMAILNTGMQAELDQLDADYHLRGDLIAKGDKDELKRQDKFYKEWFAIRAKYRRQRAIATDDYSQSQLEHTARLRRLQSDADYARNGGDSNVWWGDAIRRRYARQREDIQVQMQSAQLTPEQREELYAQLNLLGGQEEGEMADHDKDIFDVMGLKLSDKKKDTINETLSFVGDAFNSLMELEAVYTQKAIENAQKRVDATKNALYTEMEARANGYANNVEYAQKEYDNAKKMQQKALDRQKKMQKVQLALNAAEQVSNLVTATSKTWKEWGSPWAIPFIALMWTSWAASKIMAVKAVDAQNESTEYGEGGYELLQGGSHQSGRDIDLGRTQDGRKRRAEGGEFFAIINKKSSRRYRKQIPQVINALNDGTFERRYMRASEAEMGLGRMLSAYDKADGITLKAESRSNDLRRLESDVRQIKEQGETRSMFDGKGNEIVYYKNLRRVITRA